MGNTISIRKFVADPDDWKDFTKCDWRSLRARELDALLGMVGGLLARGCDEHNLDGAYHAKQKHISTKFMRYL